MLGPISKWVGRLCVKAKNLCFPRYSFAGRAKVSNSTCSKTSHVIEERGTEMCMLEWLRRWSDGCAFSHHNFGIFRLKSGPLHSLQFALTNYKVGNERCGLLTRYAAAFTQMFTTSFIRIILFVFLLRVVCTNITLIVWNTYYAMTSSDFFPISRYSPSFCAFGDLLVSSDSQRDTRR